ncbi:MAG: patatin-like phospholipase family protein [Pirellulaceae bacterium]
MNWPWHGMPSRANSPTARGNVTAANVDPVRVTCGLLVFAESVHSDTRERTTGNSRIDMDPKHLALLRIHDACRGLSHDDVKVIAQKVQVVRAAAGDQLHTARDPLNAVYIVVEGRLKMTLEMPDGSRRTIRYIAAGDQFGALMLVSGDDIPVNVQADEASVLLRLDGQDAEKLAEQFPVFRRNLLGKVGAGFRDTLYWRRKKTTSKIIAFVVADDQHRQLVAELATQLKQVGETIGVLCDSGNPGHYDSDVSFHSLCKDDGQYLDARKIDAVVNEWPQVSRIMIVVDRTRAGDYLKRVMTTSDQVFCLTHANDFQSAIESLKHCLQSSPDHRKKTHLVWSLAADTPVAPHVVELNELVTRDFKVPADGLGHRQGIDRLVHYLRGVSIGIALSGGAAHGMAHLGVLKALDETGITIDLMSGTSAGVLSGAMYCSGRTPDWGANQFAQDLEPGGFYKWAPGGDGLYMLEKYRSGSWDKMLRKYLFDWRLEQLPIPMISVTTDLVSACSVTRQTGDVVDSILESINLPVLAKPICRDGMLLVDGGILNNLPADVLVDQNCNMVIGVDVAANIEHQVGNDRPETPTGEMKAPGMVTTLMRSLSVQAHNMSAVGAKPADVVIAPDVSHFDATAFTQAREMAEVGYQATQDSLPRIREILHHLDSDLFGE